MESRPEGTNIVDPGLQTALPDTISAQPWWSGTMFAAMSTSKQSSAGTEVGQSRVGGGMHGTGDVSKQTQSADRKSGDFILLIDLLYKYDVFSAI